VGVHDSGVEGTDDQDTVAVTIAVDDVEDNAAYFSSPYTVSVAEDAAVPTAVVTVQAINADATAPFNSNRYEIIEGNDAQKFVINADSGVITLNGGLDREATASYTLKIAVFDGSSPSPTFTTVTINVNDVEDNTAAFETEAYTASVAENSAADTVVVTVHATDADATTANNQLTYRIVDGNSGDVFAIDAVTGVITVKGSIDRESTASFTLTVGVHDSGVEGTDDQDTVAEFSATEAV